MIRHRFKVSPCSRECSSDRGHVWNSATQLHVLPEEEPYEASFQCPYCGARIGLKLPLPGDTAEIVLSYHFTEDST